MRLFKYLHPDRVDVLAGKTISFSQPENLNDPFEMKPPIDEPDFMAQVNEYSKVELNKLIDQKIRDEFTGQELRRLGRDKVAHLRYQFKKQFISMAKTSLPKVNEALHGGAQKAIGVLCLSERQDDILMWAHYTNSHEGYVIEFDPMHSFFNARRSSNDDLRHLRQIKYADSRPTLSHKSMADMAAFLTKSKHWEYEKEWRMMVAITDSTYTVELPDKTINLFAFPAEAVKSVTLGCRASSKTVDAIFSALDSDSYLSKVPVFRAVADKTQFRLNILSTDRIS